MDSHNSPPTQDMQMEETFTCTASDSGTTTDDLAGPGRGLDKLFGYVGRWLELLLGKVSVKMGKGPIATATRIRRNRDIVTAVIRSQNCYCNTCRIRRELGMSDGGDGASTYSPPKLRKLVRGINRDCKQLVGYVNSREPSTQKQALDSILDLSVWDGEIRAMLKAHGASITISSMDVNRKFRSKNREACVALAASSRKALVSLDDGEVNALLREWVLTMNLCKHDYRGEMKTRLSFLWKRISVYLWDAEHAFLVMRILGSSLLYDEYFWSLILETIKDSPEYFEWSECERIMYSFCTDLFARPRAMKLICNWLFKNADQMPRIFNERTVLAPLVQGALQPYIWFYCRIKKPILDGLRQEFGSELSLGSLRSRYTSSHLQPLLRDLVCPVTRMVRNFALSRQLYYPNDVPGPEEAVFHGNLANLVASPKREVRDKAWLYVGYFLKHDVYRCNMLLNAISQTSFSPPEGFAAFAKTRRGQCIPEESNWARKYYRYLDSIGTVHIEEEFSFAGSFHLQFDERVDCKVLEIPRDWCYVREVARGEPVSTTGHFPFIVGHDTHARPTYLVKLDVRVFCREMYCIPRIPAAIKDGTKPEDLRVEVHCAHRKVLAVPEKIEVIVLCYAPEACAKFLGVDAKRLFTTGRLSWKPVQWWDIPDLSARHYRYRVLTIEEAKERGYSEEEIYPADPQNQNLPYRQPSHLSSFTDEDSDLENTSDEEWETSSELESGVEAGRGDDCDFSEMGSEAGESGDELEGTQEDGRGRVAGST